MKIPVHKRTGFKSAVPRLDYARMLRDGVLVVPCAEWQVYWHQERLRVWAQRQGLRRGYSYHNGLLVLWLEPK